VGSSREHDPNNRGVITMGTYTVTATVTFSMECDNQQEAEDIVVTMLHHEADHNDVQIMSLSYDSKTEREMF
jgi:hypothetical protein